MENLEPGDLAATGNSQPMSGSFLPLEEDDDDDGKGEFVCLDLVCTARGFSRGNQRQLVCPEVVVRV